MKRIIPNLRYFLCLILVFCSFMATASGTLGVTSIKYSMGNGLPSNCIYGIVQDSEGFIWLGTINGLCRFDGQEFRAFRRYDDEESHAYNKIRRIMIDRSGLIWISLNTGVDTFNPSTGEFSHFDAATTEGKTVSEQTIEIIEDRDGDIWISTVSSGIFRYTPSDGALRQYVNDPLDPNSLSQDYVSTLFESSDGTIWAGTYSEGLCAFSKNTGKFVRYTKESGLSDNSVDAITEDSYGNIWLGLVRGGVSRLDRDREIFENYNGGTLSDRLKNVHSIAELTPGHLIICSRYGAVELSVSGNRFAFEENGLLGRTSARSVYCSFKDREGNIWLGSQYDGVEFIPANVNFPTYKALNPTSPDVGVPIDCIEAGKGDCFYLGTENVGVMTFDATSGEIRPFRTPAEVGEDAYSVRALLHEDGQLWIGTFQRGVEKLDLETGRIKSYMQDSDKPYSRVFSIMRSKGGVLYAATAGGVYFYDPQRDAFVSTGIDASVMDMSESGSDLVLLTAAGAVLLYNTKTRQTELCGGRDGDYILQSLSGASSLAEDHSGNVWMGTMGGGLCRYDSKTRTVTRVEGTGFSSAVVKKVIVDEDNLWLSTDIGIVKYTPRNREEFHYARTGNVSSSYFMALSGDFSSSGYIVFGTGDGVCAFLPHGLVINQLPPKVVITGIFVGNERLEYREGQKNQELEAPVEYAGRVNLGYRQSAVSVSFSALSYMSAGSNAYRYRLEGYDNDWTLASGGNNRASWNLRPGKYSLQVYGSNGDGIWNPDPCVLVIRIHPHFLRSTVAIVLYILLSLVLVYVLAINMLRRSQKKHEEDLSRVLLEQEREHHKLRVELFTTIVHEIRTPLSLIVGPMESILADDVMSSKYSDTVSVVNANLERLRSLANQLLDFQKVDTGSYQLRMAPLDVSGFVQGFLESFSFAASKNGIRLDTNVDEGIAVVTDREALTKILSNLVINAVKYAASTISVTVSHGRENSGLSIQVSNDGPTIPVEDRMRIFEAFYQSKGTVSQGNGVGIGLYTVKKLLDLMNGTICVSDNPDAKGTLFSLFIPAESASVSHPCPEDAPAPDEETETIISERLTVLVVDDNEDILGFLGTVLGETYEVLSANDGESAMAILESQDCDLVVSDIMMDGMDGIELCRRIKSDLATNHIPVVLLTAKVDPDTKIAGLETGADVFIEKPFSPAYLKAQLSSLLRGRAEMRKKYMSTPISQMHAVAKNKLDLDFLERCRQVIIDNMADTSLSVDVLSRELALSRPVVFRKIKAISGMTPNNFMKFVRLGEASRMMVEGKYKITEIGFLVGFSSSSYFAKCFAQQFGVLPTEYVRKLTEEEH